MEPAAMNMLTFVAVVVMLGSATTLYALSYDTRQIEARVRADERTADRLRSEIAILKAERAFLARPERIEPYARAMGLRPIDRGQIAGEARTAAHGAANGAGNGAGNGAAKTASQLAPVVR